MNFILLSVIIVPVYITYMSNQQIMQNISQLLKNASTQEMEVILSTLNGMANKRQVNQKMKQFSEQIIEKSNVKNVKYIKILESDSVNAIITAPTQVGKSAATRQFIETCFRFNVPVIVSTDNKTDQCEQLFTRIQNDLSGAEVKMMKVIDKSFEDDFEKCIKNSDLRFVIFCLDNSAQIKKLIRTFKSVGFDTSFENVTRFAIIHDEADTVTKDSYTDIVRNEQAESHKKWLELVNIFNSKFCKIDLKRIFVTATPENCCMLYKIDNADLISLEVPHTYRGYKDIQYNVLEDDLDIKDVLEREVQRIKLEETNEVILYCIDRKIQDGQDVVLHNLASYLKCVVNTYNGNGITAIFNDDKKSTAFKAVLDHNKIAYQRDTNTFSIKTLAIRKFYTLCKNIGEKCVVTIGKDLIARGISYVSEDTVDLLTATTMIYKPGMSMHAVGICQTIGRITGCAMPQLQRRLYAPQDVIDTYKRYNSNQEAYIKQIAYENGKMTKDTINDMQFDKYSRHIDRAKLNLKMHYKIPEQKTDQERMRELINLWWNADSIIGKILKFVYESNDGVTENELKSFIANIGSKNEEQMYHHLTTNGKEYKHVFERNSDNVTKIRGAAKEYISTIV